MKNFLFVAILIAICSAGKEVGFTKVAANKLSTLKQMFKDNKVMLFTKTSKVMG